MVPGFRLASKAAKTITAPRSATQDPLFPEAMSRLADNTAKAKPESSTAGVYFPSYFMQNAPNKTPIAAYKPKIFGLLENP